MRVKTEVRREVIINAAARLFSELGYERASMNELAKRLGGSKATLYGYFESKEALFLAVIESIGSAHLESALKELIETKGEDLEPTLQRFGEVFVSLISKPDALDMYRMVIGEAGRTEIGELFFAIGPERTIQGVSQVLQNAIDSNQLRPCNTQIAARHFMALIKSESDDFVFQQHSKILSEEQVIAMVARAIEVFMAGYAPKA